MPDDAMTDFAVAAYREDGRWEVAPLPRSVGGAVESLAAALRQLPGDGGALGLVSVGDDVAVLVRAFGARVRAAVSDITAATEWPIAAEVLATAGEDDLIEDDDDEDVRPGGDLDLVADLGVDRFELGAILEDPDAYPDEALSRLADRLGFGTQFERALDAATR